MTEFSWMIYLPKRVWRTQLLHYCWGLARAMLYTRTRENYFHICVRICTRKLHTSSSTRTPAKGVSVDEDRTVGSSKPFPSWLPSVRTPQAGTFGRGTSNGSDIAAREFKSLTPRARDTPLGARCMRQPTILYRQQGENVFSQQW